MPRTLKNLREIRQDEKMNEYQLSFSSTLIDDTLYSLAKIQYKLFIIYITWFIKKIKHSGHVKLYRDK